MTVRGSCHCGATRFELAHAPAGLTRCTCSFCTKRGALWAYYRPDQFRLLTPARDAATYEWGGRTCRHHFCPGCGCGTFTRAPDWSSGEPDFDNPRISVNAWLLDDIDIGALPVIVLDGRNLW